MSVPREFREALVPGDVVAIRALVTATGFFSAEEIGIAGELAELTLADPASGDYHFLLAGPEGALAGYTCFGRIPGSQWSWDVYWIAVAPDRQGGGLGRELMARTEAAIRSAGGRRVYVDTSSREQYAATRAFYAACGYGTAADLPDFYGPGDGKVIFLRVLDGTRS